MLCDRVPLTSRSALNVSSCASIAELRAVDCGPTPAETTERRENRRTPVPEHVEQPRIGLSRAPRGATSQHPDGSRRPLRSHYGNHSDAEVVCSGEAVIGPFLSIALSVWSGPGLPLGPSPFEPA
ncbi:hypothetical protein EYF80_035666 [Liparis tanakae]|uniref:Uncharacterized protein n=1 Tax=Liparis tanakae TaxID=230148 RepID=A0A4Z2GKP6_9TELE|nr:hypothetical protein EYF80_035666 [Liparis tanakae]